MVKVISELEKIGLSLTDEQKESIKKSMGEELYSKQELDKKLSKTQELEEKNKELVGKQETLEKELQTMRDSAPDADALNQKIAELTTTLETERKERAEKDERARLDGLVTDFFADKHAEKVFQICLTPLSRMIKAIISRTFSLTKRHSRRSRIAARLLETQLISRMGQNSPWLNL